MAPISPPAACSSSTASYSTTSTCCQEAAATRVAEQCLKRKRDSSSSSEETQAKKRKCTTNPPNRRSARLARTARICYRKMANGTHCSERLRQEKTEEKKKQEEKKAKQRKRELRVALLFFKTLQKQLFCAQKGFSDFDYNLCRQFHKYCKTLPTTQPNVQISGKKTIDWIKLEQVLYKVTVISRRYDTMRPLTSKAPKARRWLQHVLSGTPSISPQELNALCAQALLSQKVLICKKFNSHLIPVNVSHLGRKRIKLARRDPSKFCKQHMVSYITTS